MQFEGVQVNMMFRGPYQTIAEPLNIMFIYIALYIIDITTALNIKNSVSSAFSSSPVFKFLLMDVWPRWAHERKWTEEDFHVKEGGVYLLHGPMFKGVYQSEQTFLKSSFWQAVSNFRNKLQTNFVLTWFCSKDVLRICFKYIGALKQNVTDC